MITTKQQPATLTQLKNMEVVKLEAFSDRWKGIQHGELVETIHKQLDSRGIKINEEGWYTSGNNDGRLNGSMQLDIPGIEAEEGTAFSLGVQHSNLGDHALKFAVGEKIFICQNGMVIGDYAVKRRHTIGVDLPSIISNGLDRYMEKVQEIPGVVKNMKEKELNETSVNRILMTAGRERIMPWSRIGQVDREYHKPTFKEFEQKNAWGLYNAFTYVTQKCPPHNQINSMGKFRHIVLS